MTYFKYEIDSWMKFRFFSKNKFIHFIAGKMILFKTDYLNWFIYDNMKGN